MKAMLPFAMGVVPAAGASAGVTLPRRRGAAAALALMLGVTSVVGNAQAAELWGVRTSAQAAFNGGEFDGDCSGSFAAGGCAGEGSTVSPGSTRLTSIVSYTEVNDGATVQQDASATADLATGTLHADGTFTARAFGGGTHAMAAFADTLYFDVGDLTGLIPITVIATIDGAFGGDQDPVLDGFGYGDFSFRIATLAGDSVPLQAQLGWLSRQPTDTSDPGAVRYAHSIGAWSQLGPSRIVGTYLLDAADPGFQFFMQLEAFTQNGNSFSDFGTAALTFELPDDVTFTSASGVFLSTTSAVPAPSSWALLIVGFGATGAVLRRRRLSSTPGGH